MPRRSAMVNWHMRLAGSVAWMTLAVGLFLIVVGTGCSRSLSVERDAYFHSGMKYFQQGKYADAGIEFENAVQVDPHFTQGYYYLGLSRVKRGDVHSAVQAFEEEMQVAPNHVPGALELAHLYLLSNRPVEAEKVANGVLAREPDNWSAGLIVAQGYLGEGKYKSALKELRKLIAKRPNDAAIYLIMGIADVGMADYQGAESSLRRGIALNPRSPEGYEDLAHLYERTNRPTLAVHTLQDGIKRTEDSRDVYFALADFYCRAGRWTDAEAVLTSLQKEAGRTAGLYSAIGDFWVAHNKPRLAIDEYKVAYASAPSVLLDKKYAEAYITLGNAAEAERWNRKVLLADSKDEQGLLFAGAIAHLQGDDAHAVELLTQVLNDHPASIFGHYYLGIAYMGMENDAQAKAEFLECLKSDAGFAYADLRLAQLSLRSGDRLSASHYAQALIQLDPTMPEGYLLVADAATLGGNVGRADQALVLARRFAPDSPAVTVRQAILDGLQKNYTKAEAEYQSALKEAKNPTPVLTGLADLYVQQGRIANAVQKVSQFAGSPRANSELFVLLAELQLKQNDLTAAEADCRRALVMNSRSANAYFYLGQIAERRGDSVMGIADYVRAAQLSPRGALAYLLAGDLSRQIGRWAEAQRYYRSALDRQSGMPMAQAGLARTMLDLGEDPGVALSLAQRALSAAPSNAVVVDDLGWVYVKEGLPRLGIPLLLQATEKAPGQSSFRFDLGMAYFASGEKTKALQALVEARRLGLGQAEAEETQQALAELSTRSKN